MNENMMQEMTMDEVDLGSGGRGITGPEAVGLILGLTAMATGPVAIGFGLGTAAGLMIAYILA